MKDKTKPLRKIFLYHLDDDDIAYLEEIKTEALELMKIHKVGHMKFNYQNVKKWKKNQTK